MPQRELCSNVSNGARCAVAGANAKCCGNTKGGVASEVYETLSKYLLWGPCLYEQFDLKMYYKIWGVY